MSRRALTFAAQSEEQVNRGERVNTPRERSLDDSGPRRGNWCPTCQELWGAAWMAHVGARNCPACDGPVFAYIGRSPYDSDTRAELRCGQGLPGAANGAAGTRRPAAALIGEGGVPSYG
jgi:hypothetical protein